MIKIENRRTYTGKGEYVGRPTILGNKFTIGFDGDRDQVVEKYETWLKAKWNSKDPAVHREMNRLISIYMTTGELTLICWCAPLRCHAEIIAKYIEFIAQRRKEAVKA